MTGKRSTDQSPFAGDGRGNAFFSKTEEPACEKAAWRRPHVTRSPGKTREFYDPAAVEKELERVFDICHGCRRCFNLCDSFPRLFDLVDESPTQELDSVDPKNFKSVVDACTLCDMCYMTKCPYVPPHEFNLDFPHLMLRYRAMEERQGKVGFADKQLAATDRNGTLAGLVSSRWLTGRPAAITRRLGRC